MVTNEMKAKEKNAYQKPEITVIDLAAEEVLGVNCKSPGAQGLPGGVGSCLLNAPCTTIGS